MKILNTEYNNFILFTLSIILLFLIYLLYYFNLSSRVKQQTSAIDYPSKVSLKNLPTCDTLPDPMDQYILSDYFVASSANSVCVGNQKYDYVSTDILAKILQSGARYIEIPICQSSLEIGAYPVVATGELVGQWITSLNTLSVIEVLNVINSVAFKTIDGNLNYPLFINLKLYTKDIGTLDQLARNIKLVLNSRLINVSTYKSVPITMERICVLLGKIVIFCNDDYSQSTLNTIICPTSGYWNRLYYNDISSFNIHPTDPNFPKVLSKIQQTKTTEYIDNKYPDIKSIVGKIDLLTEMKNDPNIIDVLTNFNKIGATVIYPNKEDEIYSVNYDPNNALDYGCTFTALNYQIYDENMSKYIEIFSKGSFLLKPSSSRFNRSRAPSQNINDLVDDYKSKIIDVRYDFLHTYLHVLVAIKTYISNEFYITVENQNLRTSRILKQDFTINNGFQLIQSKNLRLNGAVMIKCESYPSLYISLSSGRFFLSKVEDNNITAINKASFYPVKSQCGDDTYISLRCVNLGEGDVPQYMAVSQSTLIAVNEDPSTDIKASTCFQLTPIPNYKTAVISSINNLYLYTDVDGSVFMEDTTPTEDPALVYLVEDIGKGIFKLKSLRNNKYLLVQYDNKIVANSDYGNESEAKIKVFTIGGGIYIINDYLGRSLVPNEQNLVSFLRNKPLLQAEVRDPYTNVILQPAMYGPELGTSLYWKIYITYHVKK